MRPPIQSLIDQIVDLGGPYLMPGSKTRMVGLIEQALDSQALDTQAQCVVAIGHLSRLTDGKNPHDPGIRGVNLAIETALDVVTKVERRAIRTQMT